MELLDIYDGRFQRTGATIVREKGSKIANDKYVHATHIYPINSQRQILVQKRSETVLTMPGEWAATGGAVSAGEDAFTAAQRELQEELGLTVSTEQWELAGVLRRLDGFISVWIVFVDCEIKDLTFQVEEVAAAKWITLQEYQELVAKGEFHRYKYYNWFVDMISSWPFNK